jgi:pSer/pThr/pTyr-binding forkhead associated (FHA) protein
VDDPGVNLFADSCGALAPIDLRIERADGLVLAEGALDLPCGLVGRGPECEITLTDPDVSLKHACLQVIGGRVLLADLGSRTGLSGAAAGPGYAWLNPTAATHVGPFRLYLRAPVSAALTPLDRLPNPLLPAPALVDRLPRTVLRFLNGRTKTAEWPVNRVLTFIGRDPACKISLASDDVADRHCYLLLTPTGAWVIDLLSSKGTRVNGEFVRFARLQGGDELEVGRFRMGFSYPDGEPGATGIDPPTGFRTGRERRTDPGAPPPEGASGATAERVFAMEKFLRDLAVRPAAG